MTRDELVRLSIRRIDEELTRLGYMGITVSYDVEEKWLVGTDEDGASSIIARLAPVRLGKPQLPPPDPQLIGTEYKGFGR